MGRKKQGYTVRSKRPTHGPNPLRLTLQLNPPKTVEDVFQIAKQHGVKESHVRTLMREMHIRIDTRTKEKLSPQKLSPRITEWTKIVTRGLEPFIHRMNRKSRMSSVEEEELRTRCILRSRAALNSYDSQKAKLSTYVFFIWNNEWRRVMEKRDNRPRSVPFANAKEESRDTAELESFQVWRRGLKEPVDTEKIHAAIARLSKREKTIISMRFGFPPHRAMSLEEVGHKLKVTRERVRRLQARALTRLKELLEHRV